jgi:hypothetical protein
MKRETLHHEEPAPTTAHADGLRGFFSAAQLRVDRWRRLHHLAKTLAAAGTVEKLRREAAEELARLAPLDHVRRPGPAQDGHRRVRRAGRVPRLEPRHGASLAAGRSKRSATMTS